MRVCIDMKSNSVLLSFTLGRVLFVSLIFWMQATSAQSYHIPLASSKTSSSVLENSHQVSRFHFSYQALNATEVATDHGVFTELLLPEGHYIGDVGAPKLPATRKLIEVPLGAHIEVNIINYSVTEISLSNLGITYPLMPVQPSSLKNPETPAIPFQIQQASYDKSDFSANDIAEVELLGMLRGLRVARLTIAPVAYNPQRNTIQVYNDIEVELRYTGADTGLESYVHASTYTPYFDVIYQQVLNPSDKQTMLKSYPDLSRTPVKMLVISHIDFKETLQPFLDWQTRKGYHVIAAYTNEIGNTPEAIRNYIQNQYQQSHPGDPAPTFLVLVGDVSKLPASGIGSASKKVTDLYYASVDGDVFPDMYYGRLSARNNSELKNQIDKILYYQQYQFEDPSYLDDVTLIAGEDSFWNHQILQPTVKYATNNYYNTLNGFSDVNAFLTNYTGSYNTKSISVGYINFTGHCWPTEWYRPTLLASNIYQMNNRGKYPLVIGNCCQSGLFSHTESIGEAWVRAREKGAVAYIGSAPDTHWFEDFYWSVGAFPIVGNNAGYVPTPAETTLGAYDAPFVADYVPVGAIQFIGNLSITQANIRGYQTQSNVTWYWEGYHTFGDPSTIIYYTQGKNNNVNHFPVIPLGSDTFEVEALPGSYIGLSKNGQLVAAGRVDETGILALPIHAITSQGTASLVVTKPQYIPYIQDINVALLEGAYVVLDHTAINDESGNNNQRADYGESISLHMTMRNIGSGTSGSLKAQLTGGDEFVSISNPGKQIDISPLLATEGYDTVTVFNAFTIEISEQVPNEHVANFQVDITDGLVRWRSNLRITAFAPKLQIYHQFVINDSQTGNGNGRLDQGETANVSFRITNKGGATANNPTATLQTSSPYLDILTGESQSAAVLDPGNSLYTTFAVRASYHADNGTKAPITLRVHDGMETMLDTAITIGFSPNITIGNENIPSGQYPFYNIYKANRSQFLYTSEELGPGAKTITSLGFDIMQISSQYNALPNFKILIKHTSQDEFTNAFADMSDATTVFVSPLYQMPSSAGWHTWNIEHFDYDGEQNIIIEVVWGSLPGWTTNFFKVACTAYSSNRVAYGYSDIHAIAPYNGMSYLRPNIALSFTAEPVPIPWPVTFIVNDGAGNPLRNIIIQVGEMSLSTNEEGIAIFELLSGDYSFTARENGNQPFIEQSFTVDEEALTIPVQLIKYYDAEFFILDNHNKAITDATITVNGEKHEPGNYLISSLTAGNYDYVVSRDLYFNFHGGFSIHDSDVDIHVTMLPDNTGIAHEKNTPGFNVFPVPARNYLYIEIPTPELTASISLHNAQGHQVQFIMVEAHTNPGSIEFNVGELAPGLYYVKMMEGNNISIQKVIIYQ